MSDFVKIDNKICEALTSWEHEVASGDDLYLVLAGVRDSWGEITGDSQKEAGAPTTNTISKEIYNEVNNAVEQYEKGVFDEFDIYAVLVDVWNNWTYITPTSEPDGDPFPG